MTQSDWTPETFLAERVTQYQGWYDRKAVTAKSRYLQMRGFSVVAGGVVPVLINIPQEADRIFGLPVVRLAVTVISLLVVISVSLESVFHYREQWKNYRSTEQLLGHETIAFKAGVPTVALIRRRHSASSSSVWRMLFAPRMQRH
jgi:hypothetical protein